MIIMITFNSKLSFLYNYGLKIIFPQHLLIFWTLIWGNWCFLMRSVNLVFLLFLAGSHIFSLETSGFLSMKTSRSIMCLRAAVVFILLRILFNLMSCFTLNFGKFSCLIFLFAGQGLNLRLWDCRQASIIEQHPWSSRLLFRW